MRKGKKLLSLSLLHPAWQNKLCLKVSEPKIAVATCKLCMGVRWGPGSHHRDWYWGSGWDWEGALTALWKE